MLYWRDYLYNTYLIHQAINQTDIFVGLYRDAHLDASLLNEDSLLRMNPSDCRHMKEEDTAQIVVSSIEMLKPKKYLQYTTEDFESMKKEIETMNASNSKFKEV